jgi:hypothetical protein
MQSAGTIRPEAPSCRYSILLNPRGYTYPSIAEFRDAAFVTGASLTIDGGFAA